MNTYKIQWDIEIDADNPLEAAKIAQEWMEEATNKWLFHVQKENSYIVHAVDLNNETVIEVENYKPLVDKF